MQVWMRMGSVVAAVVAALASSCTDDYDSPYMPPTPGQSAGDTFALTNTNRLVSFNRATRSVRTVVVVSGLQNGETVLGADFRPGGAPAGQLYALGSNARLYTIDTTTGVATFRFSLSADSTDTTAPF